MVAEWQKATSLCQDPCLLHPVLIGGGAEGAGQWPSHHPLHEGNTSEVVLMLFVCKQLYTIITDQEL